MVKFINNLLINDYFEKKYNMIYTQNHTENKTSKKYWIKLKLIVFNKNRNYLHFVKSFL